MKLLNSIIVNPSLRVHYDINDDHVVRVQYFDVTRELKDGELVLVETLSSVLYYDFTNIEPDKVYLHEMPFIQVAYQEDELYLTVVCYTEESLTEEEKAPEWYEIELSEFEIPEESEIKQLKELVPEEPKIDPLIQMKAENKALEIRIEEMKRQLEDDRRMNEATTLEVLELMMSML